MRNTCLALVAVLFALTSSAQAPPIRMDKGVLQVSSAPSGACTSSTAPVQLVVSSGAHWCCQSDVWTSCDAGGSGDVTGPASSVDNQIARFDSTTGKLLQAGGGSNPPIIGDIGFIRTGDIAAQYGTLTQDGTFQRYGASSGSNSVAVRVFGDADWRFILKADGDMSWGDGTLTQDTNLYRSAADTLKTDDNLIVGTQLSLTRQADSVEFKIEIAGNGDLILVEQ